MAILTESDIPIYAPSVTLTGDALTGALLNVQYQIESPMGANRPLEVTQYTEQKHLNYRQQTAYLSYSPLVIDDDYPIAVKVRIGNEVNKYGQGIPVSDWETLDSSDYVLDRRLGRINLNYLSIANHFGWYSRYDWSLSQSLYTEIEVTYYSGFDFDADPLPSDVKYLKSMTG